MSLPDELLVNALLAVARNCDGASSNDGKGFNGTDTKFGKQLAVMPPEVWTEPLQRHAWEMLHKYRSQITAAGLDYDAIPEPPDVKKSKDVRAIDVKAGKVLVFLPYGDVAYPKTALSAVWNRDLRGWQVSPSKYGLVLSWAQRFEVPVTERAKAILDTAEAPIAPHYMGTVTLEHGHLVVKFEYHPAILDAIRTIPSRRWNAEHKEWILPKESVGSVRKIANEYNLFMSADVKRLPEMDVKEGVLIRVNDGSFALSFDYDANLISQVRQMPGSIWSATNRAWLVPIEASDEVLAFVQERGAVLTPEARQLLNDAASMREVIDASAAHDADITIPGFGTDKFQLFPFQRAGVAYSLKRMGYEYHDDKWKRIFDIDGGVLIGDEMGLGKSCQGLALLKATESFPAVIVCPASLKLNWKREAEQWIPGIQVKVLSGTSGNLPDADVYVINYDILDNWVDKFVSVKGIVLDESHYVKNGRTIRSKASIQLSDRVAEGGIRVCLSGTPIVNQPLEIMTQLRIIYRLDELFGGATKFRNTYGRASNKSLALLNRKLRSSCYVRRRKIEVLTELPAKRWSQIIVEGDPKVMKEYREAEANIVKYLSELAMKLALESGADTEEAQREAWQRALRARAAEHLVSIATLKQLAAKAKMTAAREWIDDFLAQDKKLVVFGWHKVVVDMVAEEFANNVKIQGGISIEKRQAYVDLFQNSDEQKVISCQIKAAGVGLTLTAASDVLFIEQGWTPAEMEQAVDRCHRIGQQDSVTGWLMLTENTIDEDIAALIDAKRAVVNRAIDGAPESDEEEETSMVGDLLVSLAERGMRQAS